MIDAKHAQLVSLLASLFVSSCDCEKPNSQIKEYHYQPKFYDGQVVRLKGTNIVGTLSPATWHDFCLTYADNLGEVREIFVHSFQLELIE